MDIDVELGDLLTVQPWLEWGEILSAAAIVLGNHQSPPYLFPVEIRDVPGSEVSEIRFRIESKGIDTKRLARLRRTYEPPRFVETAAIALAELALYHAGKHQMMSVHKVGTVGDYEVDAAHHILEVGGRSRRRDFEYAYKRRRNRLLDAVAGGFYLFVAEFQTPRGRLSFHR